MGGKSTQDKNDSYLIEVRWKEAGGVLYHAVVKSLGRSDGQKEKVGGVYQRPLISKKEGAESKE